MSRPNILYLHSHDTGRMVQPYGLAVPTPHIQRLAEEGVLFRQAFCAAPTCSPSRAALLTGQCAHSAGMIGLAHRGFALHTLHQHLVHTLRTGGYSSALIGVQHVASAPEMVGYDSIVAVGNRAERVAPAAVKWLRQASSQPFFLDVGFFETHREFHPARSEDARYVQPPRPLPDTPETRGDVAAFQASARVLDAGIGTVLEALAASGLADNTLVICTTDHGPAFPGMKCNLTDDGLGVMLILRAPAALRHVTRGMAGGQVCDALVSQLDVFPTLCDLVGLARPAWLQGRSFLPVLRGEVSEINDEIHAEVTYHAAYEPQRAVRTRRFKYIRRYEARSGPVLPNCDDSPSKDVWLAHGWRERAPEMEQLYDLVFDPCEERNLAGDGSHADALAEMRARLEHWMLATDDPLLRGPVPAPQGARVNDPDGLSPSEPTQAVL